MKILSTGNPNYGVAAAIKKIFNNTEHTVDFVSRNSSIAMDLCDPEQMKKFSQLSLDYDAVINNVRLKNFSQTLLLDKITGTWTTFSKKGHIINLGSSSDSVRNFHLLYSTEKASLKKYSDNHSFNCTFKQSGIKVTYLSFGWVTNPLSNHSFVKEKKHDAIEIAGLIKWILEYPVLNTNINEIRIEPIQ